MNLSIRTTNQDSNAANKNNDINIVSNLNNVNNLDDKELNDNTLN